jgi:DNA repair protein RadD
VNTSLFPLRPLQKSALDALKSSISAGKRRVVLQLPTGAGKTVIAAHMVAGGLAKRKRIAFAVPLISLVDQTVERFVENGINPADIGVMQADHPLRRPQAPVQIASVQTLDRRGFPEADFVIVDEAHVRFRAIDRFISERPNTLFVGLTATPWAKGMGDIWDDLIVPTTLRELIDLGWLAPFRVFAAAKPDLSGVKTVAGEYHEGQLSEVMSGKQIVADVISTWLEKGENRPTLLFAVDRAHAATLHEQFEAAGVGSAYVDGETPREERAAILGRYKAGEVRVICSVGTMTTGVDIPCQCVIDAAPTKSEIRHVQKIGRALRNEPGKDAALIFDHAGNCLRLGLPTEIGRTTLRTTKGDAAEKRERDEGKTKSEPLPRECKCCGCLMPARSRKCEACGFEFKRQSEVETIDGELVELGAKPKGKETVADKLARQGRRVVWAQIRGMAIQRGWKPGRDAHLYRSIFGTWPRNMNDAPPISPTPELLAFEHSKRIAYAKGKAAANKAGDASPADGKALADAA